jgi:Leucine-rich repeat (LRR) protein
MSIRIKQALHRARDSGTLNVSNMTLSGPTLPHEFFDLRSDPDAQQKAWECYGEEALVSVDLSDNDLRELDERIGVYESLRTLRARRCNLFSINQANLHLLSSLTNLQRLDVSFNSLSSSFPLPPNLIELDISNNRIESLSIHLPPSLTSLDASSNALTSFLYSSSSSSSPLSLPRALRKLNLSKNRLTSFLEQQQQEQYSEGYSLLLPQSLETLILSDNAITFLSPNIDFASATKLSLLDLQGNKLTSFASYLPHSLSRLDISYNVITSIGKQVLALCSHLSIFLPSLVLTYTYMNSLFFHLLS